MIKSVRKGQQLQFNSINSINSKNKTYLYFVLSDGTWWRANRAKSLSEPLTARQQYANTAEPARPHTNRSNSMQPV